MSLLLKLILAHILGDFVFQSDKWVQHKKENKARSSKLYLHILVHIVIMAVLIADTKYILLIIIIGILHYLIDLLKLYVQTEDNQRIVFVVDQIIHVLTILVVANYYLPFLHNTLHEINIDYLIVILITILLTTTVSSKMVKIFISKWSPENEDHNDDSLSHAGSYIGILERLFVVAFVITNNIQAVGFLLAAKSVFRFGDLKDSKDRKLTEYILIGTLLSFGMAIVIGMGYLYVKEILAR